MLNKSGRKPFGTRVMVKMKTVPKKTAGGIIVDIGDSWERKQLSEVVGQIVEIGANAWYDITDPPKVGDYVIVKRYAGVHIPGIDEEAYRSVMDIDIHTITENGDDVDVVSA